MRAEAGGDLVGAVNVLSEGVVTGADDAVVQALQMRFIEVTGRLHTWRYRAAIELLLGECTEHTFAWFGAFLVAHGRETFERIAADADALAVAELAGPPTQQYDQWTYGTELSAYGPGLGNMFGSIVMHRRPGWADGDFDRSHPAWASLAAPPGEPYPDAAAARADLPRTAATAADRALELPGWELINLGPKLPLEGPSELLVEIYTLVNDVPPDDIEDFFNTVERYLVCQEHGLSAQWFDDGEQVGEHYIYSIWRAPEDELLHVARLVAGLPFVPPGTFALVTTTADQLSGRGRRVDLDPMH